MRILIMILLTGLASLAMAAFFAGNTLAQQDLVVAPHAATGTAAILALGDNTSAHIVPVHKFRGGGFRGRGFRSGFYLGYPGLGYGWYGGYPYGSSYIGSYLDTPSRTCVWNGYKYRCYNFDSGTSYLY